MASSISDFIIDSKLEVEVFGAYSLQTKLVSNPKTGQRRVRQRERWERTRELGKGSFGVVWLENCTDGPSVGEVRAVKGITKGKASAATACSRELEAIAKFSQERYRDSFVRSFGWYESTDVVFITMEYLPLGSLERHLYTRLSSDQARQITQQLLEGLEFMHDNNFAHRDLKPDNILVLHKAPRWWVKIADFGITKRIDSTLLRTVIGTEAYLAPEVRGLYTADSQEQDEGKFSFAVDIWAVGAITYRMVTTELPFPPRRKLFNYVVHGAPFPREHMEDVETKCVDFIMMTMAASPRQRPTSKQAQSSPWILTNGTFSEAGISVPKGGASMSTHPSLGDVESTSSLASVAHHGLGDVETASPFASAQWTTLGDDIKTLHVEDNILLQNDSDTPTLRVQDNAPLQKGSNNSPSIIAVTKELPSFAPWQEQTPTRVGRDITRFTFSPDARWFATSHHKEGVFNIWTMDEQSVLKQVFRGRHEDVVAVSFSPNGCCFVSGCSTKALVWEITDTGELKKVQELRGDTTKLKGLGARGSYQAEQRPNFAFSPDGHKLVLLIPNKSVGIWMESRGRFELAQNINLVYFDEAAFLPNGQLILRHSPSIQIWGTNQEGMYRLISKTDIEYFYCMSPIAKEGRFATMSLGTLGNIAHVWATDKQGQLKKIQNLERGWLRGEYGRNVTYSLNGRWIAHALRASFFSNYGIQLWEEGKGGKFYKAHKIDLGFRDDFLWTEKIEFSADGRWLILVDGSKIRKWALPS